VSLTEETEEGEDALRGRFMKLRRTGCRRTLFVVLGVSSEALLKLLEVSNAFAEIILSSDSV
jgi:hypothetical protein